MSFKYKVKYYFTFIIQSLFPYHYKPTRYADSFLTILERITEISLQNPETLIYCFWTGNNEMTDNRKRCLKSLIDNAGVPVKLVTPENIESYILKEHPLHPAFQFLSAVHKSDYLRCYFMHFYGGGYSDVKMRENSWLPAFDTLRRSDKRVLGYGEKRKRDLAVVEGNVGVDLRRHFLSAIGNCSYICRPYTSFTNEWYTELLMRMDSFQHELIKFPGNILGDNEGYPIPWTNILGSIFHPLCLKYKDQILQSDIVKPNLKNYR